MYQVPTANIIKIKFIKFQIVPTIELSKLTNLTYLSLSGNCFTSIPPVALLNLFHLRELYLDRLDSLIKIDSRYVSLKYTKNDYFIIFK